MDGCKNSSVAVIWFMLPLRQKFTDAEADDAEDMVTDGVDGG